MSGAGYLVIIPKYGMESQKCLHDIFLSVFRNMEHPLAMLLTINKEKCRMNTRKTENAGTLSRCHS